MDLKNMQENIRRIFLHVKQKLLHLFRRQIK